MMRERSLVYFNGGGVGKDGDGRFKTIREEPDNGSKFQHVNREVQVECLIITIAAYEASIEVTETTEVGINHRITTHRGVRQQTLDS